MKLVRTKLAEEKETEIAGEVEEGLTDLAEVVVAVVKVEEGVTVAVEEVDEVERGNLNESLAMIKRKFQTYGMKHLKHLQYLIMQNNLTKAR